MRLFETLGFIIFVIAKAIADIAVAIVGAVFALFVICCTLVLGILSMFFVSFALICIAVWDWLFSDNA